MRENRDGEKEESVDGALDATCERSGAGPGARPQAQGTSTTDARDSRASGVRARTSRTTRDARVSRV